MTYTLHPGESDRKPKTTEAYETFDASLKKWVYFSFSSDGDYGISYSDGWSNGIKVYRPAEKDPQQFRYTFKRVNDRESTEVVEIPSGSQWRVSFASLRQMPILCRKSFFDSLSFASQ